MMKHVRTRQPENRLIRAQGLVAHGTGALFLHIDPAYMRIIVFDGVQEALCRSLLRAARRFVERL